MEDRAPAKGGINSSTVAIPVDIVARETAGALIAWLDAANSDPFISAPDVSGCGEHSQDAQDTESSY